jgi:RNA polymerase sigma-70 factor, ECF subfamily
VDHARRTRRSVLTHADQFDAIGGDNERPSREPESPLPGPDQHSIDADTSRRIREAIALLPPRQRMVFVLRHEEGKSIQEIANAMQCTVGTVKRYLFDATRTMREALNDLLHEANS